MRIGILALLHESNTFLSNATHIDAFDNNMRLTGEPIRAAMRTAHHEVGGFFGGLEAEGLEAVPLFAARALPSGTLSGPCFATLVEQLLQAVAQAGELDGYLVAPHGATVSEEHPDADGYWMQQLRAQVGDDVPIIGTLDAHANLSRPMVRSCNAWVAYRSNPHLDQRARGHEAAELMARTVRGEISPQMSALLPPLAMSIDRQCTDEPHLSPLYDFADQQLSDKALLSNSIVLGFPYADVAELGSAVISVADNTQVSERATRQLGERLWDSREAYRPSLTSVDAALDACLQEREATHRVCLLDMGDNVGGGSAADGTELLAGLAARRMGDSFVCLFDPEAVEQCQAAAIGDRLTLTVGGKTDHQHGSPVTLDLRLVSLHPGRFRELQPRHGGMTEFDQGRTAICRTDYGLTLMLTSRRMVPFSLEQLRSCDLDPQQFRWLVAKGVNAPIAAYREVCEHFQRVNTRGATCADMRQLSYTHRRRPLYPLELDTVWEASTADIVWGHGAS